MENQTHRTFNFDIAGIVLIDEIDAHLHLEMQKNIMPLLTIIFPNIQFVVTTHSPFILNSIDNAVIYDLENKTLVENGLQDIPYDGIVEGYFGAKTLSNTLNKKFERYKELSKKDNWSDDEVYELQQLELYLDEIPDYLALNITTEYQRLKLQIDERMEING
jgi:predicted ATPase